jgi:UDP-glucose 4-epimerase
MATAPPGRVLVTGGAGFVGSHLVEQRLRNGWQVTVLDNLVTGTVENLDAVIDHPNLRLLVDDVTEVDLGPVVAEVDEVVHLAAVVGVRRVVEDPLDTLVTNITGTEVVLRAAVKHDVKVLLASTSEVYGKTPVLPFSEDNDVVIGATSKSRWSYAVSKMVDEFMALGFNRQHGLPTVVFRLFNTVGPRQTGRYGMVLPRFVEAALTGGDLMVHGDGQQRRCFAHVADVVNGIDALSACEQAPGQVFNIGTNRSVSILELAELVRARVGETRSNIRFVSHEEVYGPDFEDMRAREPDTAKITGHTGWRPTRSLEQIIDDVIACQRGALAVR